MDRVNYTLIIKLKIISKFSIKLEASLQIAQAGYGSFFPTTSSVFIMTPYPFYLPTGMAKNSNSLNVRVE